jgi:hypothetical protein
MYACGVCDGVSAGARVHACVRAISAPAFLNVSFYYLKEISRDISPQEPAPPDIFGAPTNAFGIIEIVRCLKSNLIVGLFFNLNTWSL